MLLRLQPCHLAAHDDGVFPALRLAGCRLRPFCGARRVVAVLACGAWVRVRGAELLLVFGAVGESLAALAGGALARLERCGRVVLLDLDVHVEARVTESGG